MVQKTVASIVCFFRSRWARFDHELAVRAYGQCVRRRTLPQMKRALLPLVALVLAPAAVAAGWPGPPRTPAPRLTQQGPPPAWAETKSRATWMAFSSYCWSRSAGAKRKAVCADMIPPQSRTDVPTLAAGAGDLVRFHFTFAPRSVHLTVFHGGGFKHFVLAPRRTVSWRQSTTGIASLDARAGSGNASYLVRIARR